MLPPEHGNVVSLIEEDIEQFDYPMFQYQRRRGRDLDDVINVVIGKELLIDKTEIDMELDVENIRSR